MNKAIIESIRKRKVLWKKESGAPEGHQGKWRVQDKPR